MAWAPIPSRLNPPWMTMQEQLAARSRQLAAFKKLKAEYARRPIERKSQSRDVSLTAQVKASWQRAAGSGQQTRGELAAGRGGISDVGCRISNLKDSTTQ